jgi:RNA polymerase sigma-70 factor (ECF subfamily)
MEQAPGSHQARRSLNLRTGRGILQAVEVNQDERQWVRRARLGDRGAWDALLSSYQLRLFGFARRLVEDKEDALDIVQETFTGAIRHIASLRDDERFGGWLFAIARQHCLLRLRKRRRAIVETVEQIDDLEDTAESVEDVLFRQEQAEAIDRAIATLPEPQKTAILLHYFLDLPLVELAEVMQSPVGTVKSRLHFARLALRRALSEEHQ